MEKKVNLEELMNVVALTHSFQQVRRAVYATSEERFENDAEHSFQLAFIAWYLIDKEGLSINREKVLMYALCHDIVEVYAGDTFFTRTAEEEQRKTDIEKEALEKLLTEYPDFPTLTGMLIAYEEKQDNESRFVYALDKLLPILNITLDEGRSWHLNNIDFERLYGGKYKKIAHDPIVQEYFVLIIEVLKNNPGIFTKK